MYKAVLDSNVFVSGASISQTPPSQMMNLWRKGAYILVTSPQILEEVHEVLLRPKIISYTGLSIKETNEFVEKIIQRAYVTEGKQLSHSVSRDLKDDKFLSCAVEAKADYIITGDQDLLVLKVYKEINILTPREFLDILSKGGI